jgi:hypothetical protein
MPLKGKYKATGSKTEKVLKKVFAKTAPKAKKVANKTAPKMAGFTRGKKDPAIGSKEREADLDAVVVKGKTGLPKRNKPRRYY